MKISIELNQTWDTAEKLLCYLRLLSRTVERICEMEADTPMNWFLDITKEGEDYIVRLTHL